MQYVGIGSNVQNRIKADHHKLQYVTRDRNIWLGEVATPEPSGKKKKINESNARLCRMGLSILFRITIESEEAINTTLSKRYIAESLVAQRL